MKKRILAWALLLMAPWCGHALADDEVWCLLTDNGSAVAMSDVRCLAAADDDVTFSVIMKDGGTLEGVRKVTFGKGVPTGIDRVTAKPISVNSELSLEGVAPTTPVRLYGVDGKLVRQGTAQGIRIADLPSGIYIIQVKETSFKIRKP